jgi:hypothetical protein
VPPLPASRAALTVLLHHAIVPPRFNLIPATSSRINVRHAPILTIVILCACATGTGCTPLDPIRKSPLTMPVTVRDGIVLDVLVVRYPADDKDLGDLLWKEIDELRFPPDMRRRMAGNGLRVGLLNGTLPVALERKIQLADKAPEAGIEDQGSKVELATKPVKQRTLRIQPGRRSNILMLGESQRVPELSLLVIDDEARVQGRTYRQVLGLFATRAFPTGDGGARIELIPELEHGTPEKRFVPGEGMFKVEFGPPKEVLQDLRITAELSPGEFLVVTSQPDREGSLGHRFFTEAGESPLKKLLLIRLAQADFDDRFDKTNATGAASSGDDFKTIDATVVTQENSP